MAIKSTDWKDIAELVGIAAIVGSLIFVGLQMRQTQEIALAQTFQARADASYSLNFAVTQSPEAVAAYSKLRKGQAIDADSPEGLAFCHWVQGAFVVFENSFYQYQFGFLPDSHWQRVRAVITGVARDYPLIRETCGIDPVLTDEFLQEVDRIGQMHTN